MPEGIITPDTPLIGLKSHEMPISPSDTKTNNMEATQVKEIYGQLKHKSSQLNDLLDQLSKIVQV